MQLVLILQDPLCSGFHTEGGGGGGGGGEIVKFSMVFSMVFCQTRHYVCELLSEIVS